jgi:hypothetical protein
MSVYLMAPHYLIETTIRLPNPEFSDAENSPYYSNIVRTMNNTIRTIIKTNEDTIIKQEYRLRRNKAHELYQFLRIYSHEEMRFINYNEQQYRGYILNDPFQMQASFVDDFTTLSLEFRGRIFG